MTCAFFSIIIMNIDLFQIVQWVNHVTNGTSHGYISVNIIQLLILCVETSVNKLLQIISIMEQG